MISANLSNHIASAYLEFMVIAGTSALYEIVVAGIYLASMGLIWKVLTQCELVITALRVYAVTGGGQTISIVVFVFSLGLAAHDIVRHTSMVDHCEQRRPLRTRRMRQMNMIEASSSLHT